MKNGFIIGGFASIRVFYLPLKHWARDELDLECRILPDGLMGFNVGDVGKFLGNASTYLAFAKEPVTLIGHSLGGLQSMWLATQFPDKVERVFAIASPIHGLKNSRRQRLLSNHLNVPQEQFDALRKVLIPRVLDKIVTISTETDVVCPPEVCYIEGAGNHLVSLTRFEQRIFPPVSAHLMLPYMSGTRAILKEHVWKTPSSLE